MSLCPRRYPAIGLAGGVGHDGLSEVSELHDLALGGLLEDVEGLVGVTTRAGREVALCLFDDRLRCRRHLELVTLIRKVRSRVGETGKRSIPCCSDGDDVDGEGDDRRCGADLWEPARVGGRRQVG
jgi:hypothetical protein